MLPVFLSGAITAAKGLPWKWIGIGAAALALVAGIFFTVRSYNQALEETQRVTLKLQQREAELQTTRDQVANLQRDMAEQAAFFAAREKRSAQAADRRANILARREKTDAAGNIAPDDPTLTDLNQLFPATVVAVQHNYSSGSGQE